MTLDRDAVGRGGACCPAGHAVATAGPHTTAHHRDVFAQTDTGVGMDVSTTTGTDTTTGTGTGVGGDARRDDDDAEPVTLDDAWHVLDALYAHRSVVQHNIDSYDRFVQRDMQAIVDAMPLVVGRCINTRSAQHGLRHAVRLGRLWMGPGLLVDAVADAPARRPAARSGGARVGTPVEMRPMMARLSNHTYEAPLYVDVEHRTERDDPAAATATPVSRTVHEAVHIGEVPIMVRACNCALTLAAAGPRTLEQLGECPHDTGGYFIINGAEKVLLPHYRMRGNHVFVFARDGTGAGAGAASTAVAEIRSLAEGSLQRSSAVSLSLAPARPSSSSSSSSTASSSSSSSKGAAGFGRAVRVGLRYARRGGDARQVPLGVLMRALGVGCDGAGGDRALHDAIVQGDARLATVACDVLRDTLHDAAHVRTRREALRRLAEVLAPAGATRVSVVNPPPIANPNADTNTDPGHGHGNGHGSTEDALEAGIAESLRSDLLPHVGTGAGDAVARRKALYLGYAAHRLLAVAFGLRAADNRDHDANRRLELPGPMMASQFHLLLRKMLKHLEQRLQRDLAAGNDGSLESWIEPKIIAQGFKYAFVTGNWGVGKAASAPGQRSGVAAPLHRMAHASAVSHLRRAITAIGKEGKLIGPRQLHSTSWGKTCPFETPEGQSYALPHPLPSPPRPLARRATHPPTVTHTLPHAIPRDAPHTAHPATHRASRHTPRTPPHTARYATRNTPRDALHATRCADGN